MYTCIKEIPGLLNLGAKFRRKVPIINKYPNHFEYEEIQFKENFYSIAGLTSKMKNYLLYKIREKFYHVEEIEE
jgi:hypothetical protein